MVRHQPGARTDPIAEGFLTVPTRPLRPCRQQGCPALVSSGYCPAHIRTAYSSDHQRRARADEAKGADRQFYSSPAWRRVRAIVLRDQPACQCGQPSTEVDHKISRRERPDLALVRSNLEAKCKTCHSRRTATEHGGFGNTPRGGPKSLGLNAESRAPSVACATAGLATGGQGGGFPR